MPRHTGRPRHFFVPQATAGCSGATARVHGGNGLRSWVAAGTAVLLAIAGVVGGVSPAWAALGDASQITLGKSVDSQNAITAFPGDSFTFGLQIGCDDDPCIDAVLQDPIPAEFAGFTIDSLQISPSSAPVTATLTGCTVGGVVTASCLLEADFRAPLGDLAGEPQFGIPDGTTYSINLRLTVPLDLPATWPFNGVLIVNTATASDTTSIISPVRDSATVTVRIPIVVDVTPTKSWTPSSQLYSPGAASSFTIGAQNSSNLPAESLILQDPVVALDGATTLEASNPFTFVDFAGLCLPSTLPEGADRVQVDLYVRPAPGDPWNWITGSPAATATLPTYTDEVGGIRLSYTSTTGATIVADGTASAQCVSVVQRASNRTTGATLVLGATANNTVGATVTVPGYDPVSDTASAALTIGPLDIVVTPGKTIEPPIIPAGSPFTVNLSARNQSNGPLTSLTITEPAPTPAGGPFLSDELRFASFTSWTWPTGATAGTFTWQFESAADQPVPITPAGGDPAVPTPAVGDWITGFTVTYTGLLDAGTTAGMIYSVTSTAGMIANVAPFFEDYTNVIEVSGTNPAGTDTEVEQDDVRIFFPEIGLTINKTVRPALVAPGGTVVAELETTTSTNSARVNPTQIVVEDVWDGTSATDFWDAFRARELPFIAIPSGSTLTVRYTTDDPATDPIAWTDLVVGTSGTGGLYSDDLSSVPDPDLITGFQFIFDDPAGFSQGTIVKPNIVFEAAATLRDSGDPTTTLPFVSVPYDNVAVADGEGVSGGEVITANEVQDSAITSIVSFGGGTGPGQGTLLAGKDWVQPNWTTDLTAPLPSQSGATARTAHGWGVAVPGYSSVVVSDPLPGSESSPAATVFQAFDLAGIRAVTFAQDPLMRWDTVQAVEIYVGGTWTIIPAPGGTWMTGSGFTGYNPAGTELDTLRSATGVRITIVPNDAARTASTEPGRPAAGTGVAAAATERPLWLQWQLRNSMRVPTGSGWVTATQGFNEADAGTIRNDFRVAGTSTTGTFGSDAADSVVLLDNPPGVGVAKSAATTPGTTPTTVVVPFPGDVDPANFPTVRFTVDAWNTVVARASYVRVTDPVPCVSAAACVTPASEFDPDVFTGNTYDLTSNPFERFTIVGVDFVVPGAVPIDPVATQVAVWQFNGTVDTMTMAALDALPAAALANVVGIGIVYQSTDPAATGGLIPQGTASSNQIRMVLDTRLRDTLRSNNAVLVPGGVQIENNVLAQSYDPVLAAASAPNASALAPVDLSAARLDVTASKQLSPATILETNPGVPVTVTLRGTDGTATAAAESVTIADTDADFWNQFEFVALGAVTRPAGADFARVDVQLDGGSIWIQGAATTAPTAPTLAGSLTLPDDLDRITGIRYVFSNDPVRPFSATAPSADWTAEAVFTVRLRDGAEFPGFAENTVSVTAEHRGLPLAVAAATDSINLSTGIPRIDVQKESITGGPKIVEPGVVYPWTLEFENVGTAFYTVNEVFDNLGPYLRYDGSAVLYETNGTAMPTSGITVSQAAADGITFTFPPGAVLAPGEWYRITVNITLLPGLEPSQRAVNAFTVDTDVVFATGDCVNTSGNGQGVLAGVDPNQCGTTNFVSPQAGPLLLAEKEVRGEVDGSLVDGASNIVNPALPCLPSSGGFYKASCVAHTAIGVADEWRIGAVNTGTTAYSRLVFVDVLPTPGDRLLATGGPRRSEWRPVFDLGFGIQDRVVPGYADEGVPSGTTTTMQITTDTAPCVGSAAGSAWPADSTCDANFWQPLTGYAGDAAAITGLRIILDFTSTSAGRLAPGASMHFVFRTINTPQEAGSTPTAQAVRPQLNTGASQLAWNQSGVTATQASAGDPIRRAPAKVGVQLLTGSAAIQKTVTGATSLAPAGVTVDAACTVPGGATGPRVSVDLGGLATLPVPTGGTARLDGIPLGAQCSFTESGPLGAFGEAQRTPTGPQTVPINVAGRSSDPIPVAQGVSFSNRYAGALPSTGVDSAGAIPLALGLLGVGFLFTLVGRRRARKHG